MWGGENRGHESYGEVVPEERPVRPRESQQGGYVEILRNMDCHFRGHGTGRPRLPEGGVQREKEEREGGDIEGVTVVP